MTVVGHTCSAGMLVPGTKHISAATLPIVCVDSVPPVPGRAGKLRSSTEMILVLENGRAVLEIVRQLAATGPGGAADTQEPSAEGSRPAR